MGKFYKKNEHLYNKIHVGRIEGKMRFSFGFSTCVFIVVLITCPKFSSSEANDVDTKYAHITRLGESPIGAQYRERRNKVKRSRKDAISFLLTRK